MKKLLLVLLLVCLTLLVACGSDKTPETNHSHVWGDWNVTKAATCTEDGTRERACTCGEIEKGTVVALGHTPGAEATCTAAQTCTTCDVELVAARGHTEVVDKAVAPTVIEPGLTEGKHCSACGEVLVTQKVLPATGSSGLTYELNEKGNAYVVTGIGACKDSAVYIPEVYNGLPVAEIARRAFYNCSTMTELTIPASIKTIGTQVFFKAENLHTVYYNSSYGSKDNPFFSQSNVKTVVFGGKIIPSYILVDCTAATEVIMLDSVTSIDRGAFSGCTGLTSIVIPGSVTSIGWSAFENCTGLEDVYITDVDAWLHISFDDRDAYLNRFGTLHILDENGNEVTELLIPDSVTSIGHFAFYGCTSLTSIVIPDSVTSIGGSAFYSCTGLTSIVIPNSVISIGESAFENCTSLTSIVIPDSVRSIGLFAFQYCTGLTSIVIPDSVMKIDDYVFYGCAELTSVTIANGVTSIGYSAFIGCTSLTSIVIPDSVTSIGVEAFLGCTGLTDIYYTGTEAEWNAITIKEENNPLTSATIHYNYVPN